MFLVQRSSRPQAVGWQPGSIAPDMSLPVVYDPDPEIYVPAADNQHYHQVNKVLFEAHLQWIERQPKGFAVC